MSEQKLLRNVNIYNGFKDREKTCNETEEVRVLNNLRYTIKTKVEKDFLEGPFSVSSFLK